MASVEDRRCAYFVQKRGRHCRMLATKGSKYCGEHLIHDSNITVSGECEGSGQQRHRIPCPLDSSHTVFEDTLRKHMKKCNAAKKPKPSCYSAHINTGLVDYQPCDEEKLPLSAFSPKRIDELVKKVEITYQEHFIEIKTEILNHPSMDSELSDPRNGATALKHLQQQSSIVGHLDALGMLSSKDMCYIEFGAGRGKLSECIQKSFVTHSNNVCLTIDQSSLPKCVAKIESASLRYQTETKEVSVALQHDEGEGVSMNHGPSNVHYVLVDRDSCRRKVDGSHRVSTLVGAHYHRLLMDIEHLDLSKLEFLNSSDGTGIKHIVAVSKHLCGAATDLSLRCIIQTLLQKPHELSQECSRTSTVLYDSCSQKLSGVVIALCCHHRCSWPQFAGRSFFERLGFTPVDFHLICHMSSWAVCGMRPPPKSTRATVRNLPGSAEDDKRAVLSESELQASMKGAEYMRWGYVPHPNEEIGLKCKRLIDLARLDYLRENGLKAWLVYYVSRSTSLENVLLIAVPKSS